MVALLCCNVTILLMQQSIRPTADDCLWQARPTTTYTGLDQEGRCNGCTNSTRELEQCTSAHDRPLVASSIRKIPERWGCWDRWCLACDKASLSPPPGTHVYISSDCRTSDSPPSSPGELSRFSIDGPVEDVTFHIPAHGAILTNGPLIAVKAVAVVGGPLWIVTPSGYEQCSIMVKNKDRHNPNVKIGITSVVYAMYDAECAVSIAPGLGTPHAVASGSMASTYKPSHLVSHHTPYYDLAVANVEGTLSVTAESGWNGSMLVLDVAASVRFSTEPPMMHVANLSGLLSTFGSIYEIEVYHDGNVQIGDQSHEVASWNKGLLVGLITLLLLWINH